MNTVAYCLYLSFTCLMAFLGYYGYGPQEMIFLFSVMMFDIVTGIYKSYALWSVGEKEYYDNGKVKNTWFNTTVLKVGFFGKLIMMVFPAIFIGSAHLVGREIGGISGFIVGILAAAEVISVGQNIMIARTKKPIQEFDAITWVLQTLLDIVKEQIEKRFTTKPYKKDGY